MDHWWNDSNHATIHAFPPLLLPTFRDIFPDIKSHLASPPAKPTENLSIVAVWQKTNNDMSGYSDPVEEERAEKTGKVATQLVLVNFSKPNH